MKVLIILKEEMMILSSITNNQRVAKQSCTVSNQLSNLFF